MMPAGEGVAINAAAARLPLFKDYEHDPEAWFRQADAKFAIALITESKTKAAYVSSVLNATHDALMAHISLGDADPYAKMKAALTVACGMDKRQKMDDLLAGQVLGAETPLHFLARITRLTADLTAADYQREFFLHGLPSRVSLLLRQTPTTPLRELAEGAKVHFSREGVAVPADAPSSYVCASSSSSTRHCISAIADLPPPPPPAAFADQVIVCVAHRPPPRGGARPKYFGARGGRLSQPQSQPSPQPQRTRQGGGDVDNFGLCRFHRQYGYNARSCIPPCFAGNSGAGGRK